MVGKQFLNAITENTVPYVSICIFTCKPHVPVLSREGSYLYGQKRLGCVDCGFKKRSPNAVLVARKLSTFWVVLEKNQKLHDVN